MYSWFMMCIMGFCVGRGTKKVCKKMEFSFLWFLDSGGVHIMEL